MGSVVIQSGNQQIAGPNEKPEVKEKTAGTEHGIGATLTEESEKFFDTKLRVGNEKNTLSGYLNPG